MERRKLGKALSRPILDLNDNAYLDGIKILETDHESALKTRAAALMFIGRHDLDLTTMVKDKEIWIMKDRDIMEDYEIIAL